MTSPTQRRHDEILGRLDTLIDAVTPGDKQPGPEPVDVTEEPPGLTALLRRALGDDTVNATVTDAPVDTAPDVDPDEALAAVLYARRLGLPETELPPDSTTRDAYLEMARAAREHIEWEVSRERDSAHTLTLDDERGK